MNKRKSKSINKYLDEVDYNFSGGYVPSEFSLNFVNFIKLVNADQGGEEHKTPVMHMKMLDVVASDATRIANMLFRGSGKTTVIGEYLILYLAVYGELDNFGKVKLVMYVSDSIENGVKNMRKNLEYRWQNSEFLQTYLPKTRFTDVRWEFINASNKALIVKGYGALALSLDSKLFTDKGLTNIKDCVVGDKIFGADGKLAEILVKSEVFNKPMYEIELRDGRTLKVSEDHINSVVVNTNPNNTVRWEELNIPTTELKKLPLTHTKLGNKRNRGTSSKSLVFIKNCNPLEYSYKDVPMDPYTYGLLLGDGCMRLSANNCMRVNLTAHKDDWKEYPKYIPYSLGVVQWDKRNYTVIDRTIKGLTSVMREYKLYGHGNSKEIYPLFLVGSKDQRLELLKGLLDSDGTILKSGRIMFSSNSIKLINGVVSLIRSLGGKVNSTRKEKGRDHFKIECWINVCPFKLKRKVNRFKLNRSNWDKVAVKKITKITQEPSQCIAIDNKDHQFITDNYTRTHNTGIRGVKEMGRRPDIALLDDLISDTDARSPTVISSVEDTVYKAVTYALHPTKNKIIWNGTPFNAKDPLYKAVVSNAWSSNVFPICEKFPCSWTEFRGAWEDRFSYEYVKQQFDIAKELGKQDTFDQELMLRIMSDGDRLVPDDCINWFSLKALTKNISLFDIYITTDFATSTKDSADFSVISVWAHNYNRDWFWIDGIVVKQDMGDNLDDLFNLVAKYKPLKVGIEISGQQGGFLPWIKQMMMDRNCFFNIAKEKIQGKSEEGFRVSTNKLERFKVALPMIKQGHLYLPEELEHDDRISEALDELELASPAGFRSLHDDWIDTLSMLPRMQAHKPSNRVVLGKTDKVENFGKYESIKIWAETRVPNGEEPSNKGFGKYVV